MNSNGRPAPRGIRIKNNQISARTLLGVPTKSNFKLFPLRLENNVSFSLNTIFFSIRKSIYHPIRIFDDPYDRVPV